MSNEFVLARTFLDTLLGTEWASEEELKGHQAELLTALCYHAFQHVPFYRERSPPKGIVDAGSGYWIEQPFISRDDLVHHLPELRARHFPRYHGVIMPVQTGGSTGPPAQRPLSSLKSLARMVCTYRMFLAWKFDMSRPLIMLRKPQVGSDEHDGPAIRKWGLPWLPEERLGDRHFLDITTPPTDQLAYVCRLAPVYINTFPSNILRLAVEARRIDLRPSVPIIVSVAEFLPPEVKAIAAETFGSRVINILSSAEGGVIAIECPASGLLHIQSETVLAEIVDNHGKPCKVGEVGELVLTPFYSYAVPLIRYRSGDYVEKGPACSCGRRSPTISRLVGRREHVFIFPDGTRALPAIDRVRITELLGHEGWLLVQTSPQAAELRVAEDGFECHQNELELLLRHAIDDNFSVRIVRVDSLPLTTSGKRHFCVNAVC